MKLRKDYIERDGRFVGRGTGRFAGSSGLGGGRRGGPGGAGGGWQGRGGRGRRRLFDGTELRLVLLKLIADEPRHGYDLIRAIEELTAGAYAPSPGIVYPSVTMLQDMGHIEESEANGARKAFAVTEAGSAHLAEREAEIVALFARLEALATVRQRTDGGPIRRAMSNLRVAVEQRLGGEGTEDETLHQAAAILDEAAQKIERL